MKQAESGGRRMRFRRIGGSFQLDIQSAADLPGVLKLDEALWALTSIDITAVSGIDPAFLQFLDSDLNGRVRSDEVKTGVDFLWHTLRDHSGIDRAGDVLLLDAVDPESPDGPEVLEAARQLLDSLDMPEAKEVTLEQVRERRAALAVAWQNGDGVLPPEAVPEEELAALASDVMAKVGSVPDRGGLPGISAVELDHYLEAAKTYLGWREESEISGELLPFGLRTGGVYDGLTALRTVVDDFFLACGTLLVQGGMPPVPESAAQGTLTEYLERIPAAMPNRELELRLEAPLNPLWSDALRGFFAQPELAPFVTGGVLTRERWEELKHLLQPHGDWMARCPETPFGEDDRPMLTALEHDDRVARLQACMQEDLAADANIARCDRLLTLVLYQHYMLEFLNNYVSLSHLFRPDTPSLLQAGTLMMDGRHFTLATIITDVAAHKAIAQQSDICVMYLEATTGPVGAVRTMKLAVAVTSGHMRSLFVGKYGVFFTGNDETWDAKVIDFIQQPVSISEAFVMPFLRFGEFIGRQADKFFSTQSSTIQKNMENSIAANAATLPGAVPAPVPTSPPAVSGSMLLMGGGIGIAAIGSSVAFIAQAVQHISIGTVLAVLFGVILIFGGPVAVVSLVKLYRRNLARFLEANRCAVNRSMRLTRKMGAIFTHAPALPRRSLVNTHELVNRLARKDPGHHWFGWMIFIFIVIAVGVLLAADYYWGLLMFPAMQ